FLRPREIQQPRSKILLLQQPHIHLQPILQRETHLVLAVRQRLINPRIRQNMLRHRIHFLLLGVPLRQRQQQIQIPHRLLPPPQRPRRRHRLHRFPRLLDVRDNRRRRIFRRIQAESPRRLLEHLHRLQNVLLALLPKPRQVPQLALFCQFLDVRHRPRLERLPQHRHLLRSQRLQFQQIQNRLRIFLQQLLPQTVVARLHNLLQMLYHPLANPRQFRQLLRRRNQRLHRFRQSVNQLRRLFITPVAPDDRAINLQQPRRLPQYPRNPFVFHARHYSPLLGTPISRSAVAPAPSSAPSFRAERPDFVFRAVLWRVGPHIRGIVAPPPRLGSVPDFRFSLGDPGTECVPGSWVSLLCDTPRTLRLRVIFVLLFSPPPLPPSRLLPPLPLPRISDI